MEGLLNLEINNRKYLFNYTKNFSQLKIAILKKTGYLVQNFCYEDNVIDDEVITQPFIGKLIKCEFVDKHQYKIHGQDDHSFRCKTCRSNLNLNTYKCKHSDKCHAQNRKLSKQNDTHNDETIDNFSDISSISNKESFNISLSGIDGINLASNEINFKDKSGIVSNEMNKLNV
jgi:hypothetical protein